MHEVSEVLDLQVADVLLRISPFDPDLLAETIRALLGGEMRIEILAKAENTLNISVDDVKIDLLRHGFPSIEPPSQEHGVLVSSIQDIAAMKLNAITNRGARKDFFDVYFLLQHFELSELLHFHSKKYADHDQFFVVRALTYFEDAESEPDPILLQPVRWDTVKRTIARAVARL